MGVKPVNAPGRLHRAESSPPRKGVNDNALLSLGGCIGACLGHAIRFLMARKLPALRSLLRRVGASNIPASCITLLRPRYGGASVMTAGCQAQNIFRVDADRNRFPSTLADSTAPDIGVKQHVRFSFKDPPEWRSGAATRSPETASQLY